MTASTPIPCHPQQHQATRALSTKRHHLHSRQMALSDAASAATGQRIVQEILLTAERTRQNRKPEQYMGDRVMEGPAMVDIALTALIHERLRLRD